MNITPLKNGASSIRSTSLWKKKKREQALLLATQCVNDGTLTLLDGIDSPSSRKIKEHFQVEVFEMNSLWITSSQHWLCPCCGRSKFDISRLGKKNQILAKLVVHHDHIEDALNAAFDRVFVKTKTSKETETGLSFVKRIAPAFSAYSPILICEDCNNADTKAKRWLKEELKVGTNIEFLSFSIGQIHHFIFPAPHLSHELKYDCLEEVWTQVKPAYIARMKLIYSVAMAAVTQDYWYEKYPVHFKAIPALSENRYMISQSALQWLGMHEFVYTMQQETYSHASDWTRWRSEETKQGEEPPENHLAILHSIPGSSRMWNELESTWHCPVCNRTKYQIITNKKKKVRFNTHRLNRWDRQQISWENISHICADCHNTLTAIKREIEHDYSLEIKKVFNHISFTQLRAVIVPRPHSAHLIHVERAKLLLKDIESQMKNNE